MRGIMECDCGFSVDDADVFDRHMSSHTGYDIVGSLDWWQSGAWRKRGPVDGILRLLQQDKITRGKALELILDRARGETWDRLPSAPWDDLNWADDGVAP